MKPPKPSLSTPDNVQKKPKKQQGRFSSINNFVDMKMRDLTRVEIAVYLTLWRCEKDGKAKISQTRIAEIVGCSVESVRKAVKELIKKELIKRKMKGNNLTGEASIYVLAT
jgi:DNA-binding MarR family transcriptional regulator